jgi:hypothetical protein
VDLAVVQETFRVGERDLHMVLKTTRQMMTKELLGRLRAGKITARNLESQRRSAFRRSNKAKNALLGVLRDVADRGIQHVSNEVRKQGD